MNNLHELGPAVLQEWFWLSVRGGNGQRIGGHVAHAFLIERGTPPPMVVDIGNPWANDRRRGWAPYMLPNAWGNPEANFELLRQPACKSIKTKARWPRFDIAWEGQAICQDCVAIVGTPERDGRRILRDDPWNQIAWDQRPHTVDPISGV